MYRGGTTTLPALERWREGTTDRIQLLQSPQRPAVLDSGGLMSYPFQHAKVSRFVDPVASVGGKPYSVSGAEQPANRGLSIPGGPKPRCGQASGLGASRAGQGTDPYADVVRSERRPRQGRDRQWSQRPADRQQAENQLIHPLVDTQARADLRPRRAGHG